MLKLFDELIVLFDLYHFILLLLYSGFMRLLLVQVQFFNLLFPLENNEYCQWETFNASCGHDQLVVMQSARYGRMRFGRCMREDHGSVGCSADVLPYLDRLCSGRRTCQLVIPDATLHAIHPCPKELMPYLEASYSCVRGKLFLTRGEVILVRGNFVGNRK